MSENLSRRDPEQTEASPELVSATKQLIPQVIEKVRLGDVDEVGRQRVHLKNSQAHKLYQLTDVSVRDISGHIESYGGGLRTGLFVYELLLDESGEPYQRGMGIQIPRHPHAVDTASIYHLRHIEPHQFNELSAELHDAERIEGNVYQVASAKIYEKEQESTQTQRND